MQSHITGYLRWHLSVFIVQSQRRWRQAEGKQETCRWKTSKPWISRKARAGEIMWKRRLQERQCHLARLAPADKTRHKSCSRLPRWYAAFTCFVLAEYLLIMFDRFHCRALLDWQNLPQQFSIKHLPVSHLSLFHLHFFLLLFNLCHLLFSVTYALLQLGRAIIITLYLFMYGFRYCWILWRHWEIIV